MQFGREFFAELQKISKSSRVRTGGYCLLIQSLIIECFAIAAYNIYIPL